MEVEHTDIDEISAVFECIFESFQRVKGINTCAELRLVGGTIKMPDKTSVIEVLVFLVV